MFKQMFIVLYLMLHYCASFGNAIFTTDIVFTDSGPVKGLIEKTLFDKQEYYSFKGIPYAKAPIGDLRFVAPMPYSNQYAILSAFQHGSICLQSGDMGPIGNENCLFLNVYTPTLTPNAGLPVMFFIHGGAYFAGSGNDDIYGPDFLIEEGVILVTINYRLGVFGFMSLGDSEFSGNMGLKDQLLALKWVRKNIHHFGGDKNLITISGQSAGSRAVQYFTLSPATKNLFKRAIAMSGTVTDLWSRSYNSSHIVEITKFAQQNKSNIQNVKDVIKFMQNVDAIEILKYFPLNIDVTSAQPINVTPPFTPVVEIDTAEYPFLQQPPEAILFNPLQRSDVDMMFGTTSKESLGLLSTFFLNAKSAEQLNEYFRIPFPNRFFIPDFESAAYANASLEIRNFYLGSPGAQINATNMLSVVNLISDVLANHEFVRSIIAQQLRSHKRTTVYKISASTKLNYFKAKAGIGHVSGTSHEDDLCYLFACKTAPEMYNITKESVEMKLLKGFTRMFARFVKYGDTGFSFSETNGSFQYVHVSNDGFSVESELFSHRVQFWNNIMEKYSEMNIFSKLHPGST